MVRWMKVSQITTPNTMIWSVYLVFINMSRNLSLDWLPNALKSLYWSFGREWHAVQHAVSKFLEEWIESCCYFHHRQSPTIYIYTYVCVCVLIKSNVNSMVSYKLICLLIICEIILKKESIISGQKLLGLLNVLKYLMRKQNVDVDYDFRVRVCRSGRG